MTDQKPDIITLKAFDIPPDDMGTIAYLRTELDTIYHAMHAARDFIERNEWREKFQKAQMQHLAELERLTILYIGKETKDSIVPGSQIQVDIVLNKITVQVRE